MCASFSYALLTFHQLGKSINPIDAAFQSTLAILARSDENLGLGHHVYSTQKAADAFLGVPFNIASYALLTHMIAQQCNLQVGEFVWSGGDCHIYQNHLEQVELQLSRAPLPLPQLRIHTHPASLFDYCYEDFGLINRQSHDAIKAPIAV